MTQWWNNIPVSLRKNAGELIEFPEEEWVGKDPDRATDLKLMFENSVDKMNAMLHYTQDAFTPGQAHSVQVAIENAIVVFARDIIRISDAIQELEIENLTSPPEDAEVIPLSKE